MNLLPEDSSWALATPVEMSNRGLMATPTGVKKQRIIEKLEKRCPPDSRSYSDLGPLLLHYCYY